MAKSKEDIIKDLQSFKNDCGGKYSDWYVGVTEDPNTRVFTGHSVEKGKNAYIWRTASSSNIAREVEKFFLDKGCDGGTGGGDDDAKVIYMYKKGKNTNP